MAAARMHIRTLVPPSNVLALPTAPLPCRAGRFAADAIERFRMPVMRLI